MARKKAITDLASLDGYELHDAANAGSDEALELLRTQHKESPDTLFGIGDLARNARDCRIARMLGDKAEGTKLAVRTKSADIIKKVAGDSPTPLERLLAERIAMCWLDVQDHEHQYAALTNDTFAEYEWRSRMLDRAHNRYMLAIKTLATVRRLNLPIVQVNIAEKQINTVGLGALETPQGD